MVPIKGKILDGLNLASKLTFRKTWNAAKVLSSFYIAKWTRQPLILGLPFAVSIEPTTACNLRCPECISGLRAFSRATGKADKSLFEKVVDEMSKELIFLNLYFQGEPYLHPEFLSMVHYAAKKNIYTLTSTNGHFLSEELARKTVESGLDRLIVSVDGTTQEVYENYRIGGKLKTVLEGIKRVVYWKRELGSRKPYVIIQFLVVRPNEHQVPEVKKLGKEIGVDEVRLKTAQVHDYQNGNPLIPVNGKYSRYEKQKDGKYRLKSTLKNHCWKMWHSCVITWNGTVVPCCFDKDSAFPMGNVREMGFKQIWRKGCYNKFRDTLWESRQSIPICTNCTEGCQVWAGK